MTAKVKIIFEDTPELKERLETVCKLRGITKIDFLRQAIYDAEKNSLNVDRMSVE